MPKPTRGKNDTEKLKIAIEKIKKMSNRELFIYAVDSIAPDNLDNSHTPFGFWNMCYSIECFENRLVEAGWMEVDGGKVNEESYEDGWENGYYKGGDSENDILSLEIEALHQKVQELEDSKNSWISAACYFYDLADDMNSEIYKLQPIIDMEDSDATDC